MTISQEFQATEITCSRDDNPGVDADCKQQSGAEDEPCEGQAAKHGLKLDLDDINNSMFEEIAEERTAVRETGAPADDQVAAAAQLSHPTAPVTEWNAAIGQQDSSIDEHALLGPQAPCATLVDSKLAEFSADQVEMEFEAIHWEHNKVTDENWKDILELIGTTQDLPVPESLPVKHESDEHADASATYHGLQPSQPDVVPCIQVEEQNLVNAQSDAKQLVENESTLPPMNNIVGQALQSALTTEEQEEDVEEAEVVEEAEIVEEVEVVEEVQTRKAAKRGRPRELDYQDGDTSSTASKRKRASKLKSWSEVRTKILENYFMEGNCKYVTLDKFYADQGLVEPKKKGVTRKPKREKAPTEEERKARKLENNAERCRIRREFEKKMAAFDVAACHALAKLFGRSRLLGLKPKATPLQRKIVFAELEK